MGLTRFQGVVGAARWSFCGEPYTFEKYLTFCVEQLDPATRSDMARLGLLGYQFGHMLPGHDDSGHSRDYDGHWFSKMYGNPQHTVISSNVKLFDVVNSTMAWHIQREIEDGLKSRGSTAPYA